MGRTQRKLSRNQRMDLYRGIAIYGVVAIHVLFPGSFGSGVRALARFAVPLFFLTAGYFSLNASPRTLGRRAVRTLAQLVLACVPYFLLSCVLTARQGSSVLGWLGSLFTWDTLMELLAFHTIPFFYAWQLWFLGALFAVYLWWWLITSLCRAAGRPVPYDALAAAALVLLLVHLLLGEGASLLGREIDNRVVRNALLDGLPFFALGGWWAFRRKQIKAAPVPWHYLVLGGAVLSLIEAKLAGRQELYLGTLVMLAGLMGRCVRYRRAPEGKVSKALQYCGRELTLYIFVLHLLVLAVIKELPALEWLSKLEWLLPILVAALSTLLAMAIVQLKEKLRLERRSST